VTHATPFLAGRRIAAASLSPLLSSRQIPFVSWAWSSRPHRSCPRTRTWPGSAVRTMFGQSGYRIRREWQGYMPSDQPCTEGMADNRPTILQVSGWGTYVRIRTPAEIGGTKQEVGVVERRKEAHGVVVAYGFPDGSGSNLRITSAIIGGAAAAPICGMSIATRSDAAHRLSPSHSSLADVAD
jgi:hypothetical protein